MNSEPRTSPGVKAYLTARYQDWPPAFSPKMFKPGPDRVRELIKAGAMIAAEIDRLVRKETRMIGGESITITVRPEYVGVLERMAAAVRRNPNSVHGSPTTSPQDVFDRVLDAMSAAIDRSGSWERGAFELIFGDDLDYIGQPMEDAL